MADNDLGSQLGMQQQINKILQAREALLQNQTKILGAQIKLATELRNAHSGESFGGMNDRLEGMKNALEGAADSAENANTNSRNLGDALDGVAGKTKKMLGVVAVFGAIKSAIGSTVGIAKGMVSILATVASSVVNLGMSILSVPFKLMEGLIGIAQKEGWDTAGHEARENIRDLFGSFSSKEPSILKSSLAGLRKEMRGAGITAASVASIYGHDREGFANAIKDATAVAAAMGSAFTALSADFKKNVGAILLYRKGLGLTEDQLANVSRRALASGKSITSITREMGSHAIQMGSEFGISSKLISKDMGVMMSDFDNFGTLGVKVMSQVSVFTRKLGIEVKDLTGLVGKFDNFEDAAKGASMLAQSFGMNVDAMKLMKEQDPAARLSILQKAFRATGKSVESMSRQELKLLSSQAGLGVEATKLAFSQKGLGMSYDKVQKAGDKNNKKQLTQVQVLQKLAKDIKRVFGEKGSKEVKSFWGAFTEGLTTGILRSTAFRENLDLIRKALEAFRLAGIAVGNAFVYAFPGVRQMLEGLSEFLDPERVTNFTEGMQTEFQALFGALGGESANLDSALMSIDPPIMSIDPAQSEYTVGNFMDNMTTRIQDYFDSDAGEKFKKGIKKFLCTISRIIAELIPSLKQGLLDAVVGLTSFIENPDAVMDKAGKAGEGAQSFATSLFQPIYNALTDDKGPGAGLGGAVVKLLNVFWTKHGDKIKGALKPVAAAMAIAFVTQFALNLGAAMLSFNIGKFILKKLFGGGTKKGASTVGKKIAGAFDNAKSQVAKGGEAFRKAAEKVTKKSKKVFSKVGVRAGAKVAARLGARALYVVPVAGQIAAAGMAVYDAVSKFNDVKGKLRKKFGEVEGTIAAGYTGALSAVTLGLLPDSVYDSFGDKVGNLTKFATTKLKEGWAGAKEIGAWAADKISTGFSNLKDKTAEVASNAWSSVTSAFSSAKEWAGGVVDKISNGLSNLKDRTVEVASNAWLSVTGAFSSAKEWAGGVVDKISTGLSNMKASIASHASSAWSSVTSAFSSAKEFGTDMATRLSNGFSIVKSSITKHASSAWQTAKGVFSSAKEFGANMASKLSSGFSIVKSSITKHASSAWQTAKGVFSSAKELGADMIAKAQAAWPGIKELAIEKAGNALAKVNEVIKSGALEKTAARLGATVIKGLTGALGNIQATAQSEIGATLLKVDKMLTAQLLKNTKNAASIVGNINNIAKVMNGSSMRALKASTIYKGGKLEVRHNISGAKIEVSVNLSAKDLAHAVSEVDFNENGDGADNRRLVSEHVAETIALASGESSPLVSL